MNIAQSEFGDIILKRSHGISLTVIFLSMIRVQAVSLINLDFKLF